MKCKCTAKLADGSEYVVYLGNTEPGIARFAGPLILKNHFPKEFEDEAPLYVISTYDDEPEGCECIATFCDCTENGFWEDKVYIEALG